MRVVRSKSLRSIFVAESKPYLQTTLWTRSWVYNEWNEKQIAKTHSRSLFYTTAELFKSDDFNLAQLFKIPYQQLMELFYALSKDVHISYSDFNIMPWYEILMVVDAHNDFIERQNSNGDDQNDMIAQQQAQMQAMYQQQQNSMPKFDAPSMQNIGNLGNFNFNH